MAIPDRPGFVYRLNDGSDVFLGPVLPEDAWRLRDGVQRMSPSSRYLRFFEGLSEITPAQVRYFTRVDQRNHVAWGVLEMGGYPWPGLGIGRFARLADRPQAAEWAVAIVDDYQHRGLGSALLAILYLEAEQRDLKSLTALVLPENQFVLDWIDRLGAQIEEQPDAYETEMPVDRHALAATKTGRRLLRLMEQLQPQVEATYGTYLGAI